MVWRNLVGCGPPSVRVIGVAVRAVPSGVLTAARLFSYEQLRHLQSNKYNQSERRHRGSTRAPVNVFQAFGLLSLLRPTYESSACVGGGSFFDSKVVGL